MLKGSRRVEQWLAIVGGGAKAAAIACKSSVLHSLGLARIRPVIFEPAEIGAHWTGRHGYTDGKQSLCTPAERDLGFPYRSLFGTPVDKALQTEYSWHAYKISAGSGTGPRTVRRESYASWVDRGRLPPSHAEFAAYLAWAVDKSQVGVERGRVTAVAPESGGWRLTVAHNGSASQHPQRFDGIVVTGPGPQRRRLNTPAHARIFDGVSFWQNLPQVRKSLRGRGPENQIVIVGGGGTSAAILAWLARSGFGAWGTTLITNQATLFSRGDSVFENQFFSDEALWSDLSPGNRKQIFERLNRGVVWSAVMHELRQMTGLTFSDARARRIRINNNGDPEVIAVRWDGARRIISGRILVDASGFDPWWFVDLFGKVRGLRRWSDARKEELGGGMGEALEFRTGWRFPALHAPFLSSAVGPGFGSLMSLGGMADRILRRYCTAGGTST